MRSAKRLTFLAMLTAIVLVQEEALTAIPNVQLTFFLLFTYGTVLSLGESLMIVAVHVLLDSLWMGAVNPFYMSVMVAGYGILVLFGRFSRESKLWKKSALAGLGSLIYCWLFAIAMVFVYHVPFSAYMLSDLPFEGILFASTVVPMVVLHIPIRKLLLKQLQK